MMKSILNAIMYYVDWFNDLLIALYVYLPQEWSIYNKIHYKIARKNDLEHNNITY
jgi:hypothetical protein